MTPFHGAPRRSRTALAAFALMGLALQAQATENGLNTAPPGAEAYLAGALPPPGTYGLFYFDHEQASRFNNGAGDSAVPGFKVKVDAFVSRLVHVSTLKVAGGDAGFHVIAPLVKLKLDAAGASDSRSGLGDIELGPFVGWHSPTLHTIAAIDFVLPTGAYDATRMANTGNHITTLRPVLAMSYLTPTLDLSTKLTYSFNRENGDTQYKSGQYFHADWNAGWKLAPEWQAGVYGTLVHQTTDDEKAGAVVGDGNRLRKFALGPAVRWQAPAGLSFEGRVLKDVRSRNTSEGTAVWLKAVMAF